MRFGFEKSIRVKMLAFTKIPFPSLAVGLCMGLLLGSYLLVSLWLLYRQHCRLKLAKSAINRKSIEKPSGNWQWPHGLESSRIPQRHSLSPPLSAFSPPVRYEAPPIALSASRGPPPPAKIPNERGLQELGNESNDTHELDGYNYGSNGTREFV